MGSGLEQALLVGEHIIHVPLEHLEQSGTNEPTASTWSVHLGTLVWEQLSPHISHGGANNGLSAHYSLCLRHHVHLGRST